jgi:hypothetical protein
MRRARRAGLGLVACWLLLRGVAPLLTVRLEQDARSTARKHLGAATVKVSMRGPQF